MAKGNMLLGFARGKVGSLVFKRQNGAQVTTPRVTPKNPQTINQMAQRLAFSSAVKTAKELDGIVNHSFQGVEYGQKSIQHFTSKAAKVIKANILAALDSQLSATPFRTTAAIPLSAVSVGSAAEVLVSSGDLASPLQATELTGAGVNILTLVFGSNMGPDMPDITVARYQSVFGVPYTDQITVIMGSKRALDEVGGDTIFYGVDFKYARLNWKKDLDSDAVLFSKAEGVFNLNVSNLDPERTSPELLNLTGDLQWSDGLGGIRLPADFVEGGNSSDEIVCGCIIASRFENGAWRRSTQRLSIIKSLFAPSGTQATVSEGWAWNPVDELLASAMKTANVSEDWYLNKKKVTE